MKIIYFGAYDPQYSRNRVLIRGLKDNGVEVVECSDRSRSILKYLRLVFKYFRLKKDFDLMVVGFPGQEVMFLAKILTRKPIVFDAFTSHYGGHVLDRGTSSPKSLSAFYYKFLDRYSCLLADMVLLDTNAHINFFVETFGLPVGKFKRVFVGSDSSVFYPRPDPLNEKVVVHFHGNYIPLQGVRYIIEAAKILENESIHFNLIGRGQTYDKDIDLAKKIGVKNITFIDRVGYSELADFMTQSDICLGVFGEKIKTGLVIPNKIFEALAMSKPIVTARTEAIQELLKDEENVILCQKGDPKDLANKIRELANSRDLRFKIGSNGGDLFSRALKEKIIAGDLINCIYERGLLSK
ncbi:MAG: glycosyltransferase [Candidatus Pacebacteria bacterium]|nr:glycosyltransferase [Candidatus Paceibacterota bacterium]